MEETLFSVDDLAEILNLHPRTVRIYIHEGKLAARKIGKEWRVTRSALNSFLGEERRRTEETADSERQPGGSRIQVSAVVDIQADNADQATRISTTIIAALKGKGSEYGEVRFDFIYYEREQKARCVFWGDPGFIGNLLIMLRKIME